MTLHQQIGLVAPPTYLYIPNPNPNPNPNTNPNIDLGTLAHDHMTIYGYSPWPYDHIWVYPAVIWPYAGILYEPTMHQYRLGYPSSA